MLSLILFAVGGLPEAAPPRPLPQAATVTRAIAGTPCGPGGCHVCRTPGGNPEGCKCDPCPVPGTTTGDAPPPGYGRWLSGPNAGQLFRLDAPAQPAATAAPVVATTTVTTPPAQSPGCVYDPRTGRTVCPYQRR